MMDFTYEPLTDEEIEAQRPRLQAGIGQFSVIDATHEISKSGNPQIKLKLEVWDMNGVKGVLFDYLPGTTNMAWKLRAFCKSIGKSDLYASKKLCSQTAIGGCGKAMIKIEKSEYNGAIQERSKISEYLESKPGEEFEKHQAKSLEDDIPF